jgi:hypothetical protein
MEINRFEDVIGAVIQADTIEGRFVCLTSNAIGTIDFGSQSDLPGARIPIGLDEANRSHFVVTWPVDNKQTPFYQPYPSFTFALRQGFEQAANAPFTAKVWTTYPGNMDNQIIPSGNLCLLFTDGIFTIPSGQFIYDANIIKPGSAIVVEYSGADAGKPKYQAASAWGVIGYTVKFDLATYSLTVKVEA